MRRIHICTGPVSALLVSLFGCHEGEVPEAAPADFRVANGDIDSDNDFPYVARLEGGGGCSGILITPGLILTADHCFRASHCAEAVGVQDYSDDDWDVKLGDGPFPGDLDVDTQHSFSITRRGVTFTQPVIERIGDTISTCTKDDPSRDLAIVRLDQRIPLSQITPMHVPLLPGYPGCEEALGDGFEAITIGFGECENWNAAASCPGDPDHPRTFATSGGYGRETDRPMPPFEIGVPPIYLTTDLPGALYSGYWDFLEFAATGTYDGILPGDSGGPLISAASFPELLPGAMPGIVGNHGGNLLCGVASRYYPVLPTDVYPPPIPALIGNDFAAVDGDDDNPDDNADWLAQHVIAADGNFVGECFAGDPSLPSTLALRDQDTDDDLIPDLCDPCPEYYEPNYNEGLAAGPDSDGDGVPDRCDNCALVANPYTILGSPGSFTREQLDSDDDGYGDMCDTCQRSDEVDVPQVDPDDLFQPEPFTDYACCITDADCAPGPSCPSFTPGDGPPPPPTNVCVPGDSRGTIIDGLIVSNVAFSLCENHCAFPIDTDCDDKSDLCDTCPEDFNPSQSDKDEDGVGDLCDNCKGAATPHEEDLNPECDYFSPLGDQSCASLHPESVCLPPHPSDDPTTNVARCSLFDDPDGDGVGQGCDSCTETANPAQWNAEQKNCNQVDEIVDGVSYPYIGDACDRNPCTSFSATKQIQSEAAEDERGWVAKIEYAPRLLPPWQEGHPYYGDPFGIDCEWDGVHCTNPRATTGLRFCSCDELGADGKPDPLECQTDGCTIASSEYSSAGSWWKPSIWPQLATINGGNGPYMPEPEIDEQQMINPVPGDPLGQGSLLAENTASTSSAWWYTKNDIAMHAGGETQLEGILWSHVTMVTELLPTPGAAELEYRPWSNHYRGGVFGPPPEGSPHRWFDLPMLAVDYVYKGCPIELLGLPESQDTPTMVIDAEAARSGVAEVVGCRTAEGDVELRDAISDEARIALGLSSVMWVGASEPMASSMERMPALVALSLDGLSAPAILGLDSGRIVDFGGSPPPAPRAVGRVGFGAALSATEASLFVVGGADARTGALGGDVWRYDMNSATWTRRALEGERPEIVLAATYRASEAALYVLDVAGERSVGRLLRIDLSTGLSRALGEWERSGRWEQTFLVNTADDRLLLASSSRERGFVAVAFDPAGELRESAGPSFLSATGAGNLAVAPTLTELGLTLPIVHERIGVMNGFVPMAELLEAGDPHANLIGRCL